MLCLDSNVWILWTYVVNSIVLNYQTIWSIRIRLDSDNAASSWLIWVHRPWTNRCKITSLNTVMQCYRILDIVSLFKSVADGQIVDPAWSHSQLTCIYSNTWSNMDLKIHILMRTWTKGDTRSFKVFENQVLDRPVQASRREVSRS